MKATSSALAMIAVSAIVFAPLALHAQDQPPPPPDQGGMAPPPQMDQGAPPPPDQQGAPPPDQQGAPPPDQGGDNSGASFDEFYNGLSSQGQWVQTPDYGYAFQPNVQDPNWAPYTDGHWVYTAYGWTWASDEPWGWATYHYGRWVNVVGTGWMWVPGYQWAPAWVSWRYGGGYCGWAPLPPSTFVGVEFGGSGVNLAFGFHFGGDCDTAYGIGPGCYNFIPIGYIGNPYYRGHYIDRGRNYVIINNTRNITNINVRGGSRGAFGAVNVGGPNFAEVNRVSHTPVQEVRLDPSGRAGRSTLSGGTMSVFAPRFNPATAHQGHPATVAHSLSNVEINRGTSISQPMEVNSRFKPGTPSQAEISAAREAEAHAPKNVATSTRVAPTASAGSIQQERTQFVQKQQVENQQRTPASPNHFTDGAEQHPAGVPSNEANTQAGHNAQVEQEQAQRQQQAQQQERAAASQQQHEEAVRQQQAQGQQQQQREETYRQQQQGQQRQTEEQHATTPQHETPPFTQQQHTSSQPQQHNPQPSQQQHSPQGGGGNGGGNRSGGNGGGGNGQNKNPNNNGQNQGQGH